MSESIDFSSASAKIGGLEDFLSDDVKMSLPTNEDKLVIEGDDTDDESSEEAPTDEPTEKKEPEVKPEEPSVNITLGEDDGNTNASESKGSSTGYKAILQTLMKQKVFDEFDTIETNEGDVSLEEMDLDDETFIEIVKAKIDEIKTNTVSKSTEGLSDFTKHLLEIEKAGGNVSQAIETYRNYQDPLDNLDLTDPVDQQKAVFMKYHNVMGMDREVVIDLLEGFINKGKLEDEAIKADTELRNAVTKQMEAMKAQAQAQMDKRKEDLKAYKGVLKEKLNGFDLNESYKKKLVDLATKELDGDSFELDNMYFNLRNNPETAADVLLFLADKDEYIKQVTNKEVRSSKLDTMKKLKLVKKGGDSIKLTSSSAPSTSSKSSVAVDELFKL